MEVPIRPEPLQRLSLPVRTLEAALGRSGYLSAQSRSLIGGIAQEAITRSGPLVGRHLQLSYATVHGLRIDFHYGAPRIAAISAGPTSTESAVRTTKCPGGIAEGLGA